MMKIVLTQDIEKLGVKGEEREVADGYARNFLIPQGMAVNASDNRAKQLKESLEESRAAKQKEIEESQEKLQELIGKVITIKAKAEKDKLFAGVTKEEIAKELKVKPDNVKIEHPLKTLGEHKVKVILPGPVEAEITVNVEKV